MSELKNNGKGQSPQAASSRADIYFDEARRFLRFTLPGMVPVITLLAALMISDTKITWEFVKYLLEKAGLAAILALFITSGGVGFILVNIHFGFIRVAKSFPYKAHKKVLEKFMDKEIEIKDMGGGEKLEKGELKIRDSWNIVNQFITSKHSNFKKLADIFPYNKYLVDTFHSLGSVIIGLLFAIGLWIILHFHIMPSQMGNSSFHSIMSVLDIILKNVFATSAAYEYGPKILSPSSIVPIAIYVLLIMVFILQYLKTLNALQSISTSTYAEII